MICYISLLPSGSLSHDPTLQGVDTAFQEPCETHGVVEESNGVCIHMCVVINGKYFSLDCILVHQIDTVTGGIEAAKEQKCDKRY